MSRLDRSQLLAVGAVGTLLLLCLLTGAVAFESRAVAWANLSEQRDELGNLEARARVTQRRQVTQIVAAPMRAFLDAPTSGLATAQLQAHLARLVTDQHAALVSS